LAAALCIAVCGCIAEGRRPLKTSAGRERDLPTTFFDTIPTITRLPAQKDAIVLQLLDELLVIDLDSGELARWQVRPIGDAAMPIDRAYFQLRDAILWPDGTFYNLPAARKGRYFSLSPDGRWVAYSSRQAPYEIHLETVAGAQHRVLWPGESPIWSPDGQKLAFYGRGETAKSVRLYVINADGSDLISLIEMDYNVEAQDIRTPYLAWAPDGTTLAMLDNLSERFHGRLYRLYLDGREPALLFKESSNTWIEDLSWSPDGKYVAFMLAGKERHLYVVDVETGEQDVIRQDVKLFAWSPDGSQLAMGVCPYGKSSSCSLDIYVSSASGDRSSRLTDIKLQVGGGFRIPASGQLVWTQP
jgi:dipeptidyl aminopeptidase/acylaminoacyl peptidase